MDITPYARNDRDLIDSYTLKGRQVFGTGVHSGSHELLIVALLID